MNSELLQTYDHYLYALVAMVGTGMGVIGLQWLMRYSRWAAWVRSLAGVAPPFINIIGVLFGLTLAFLANDTWSAHDRATNAVFREADALRSLVTLSASLPEPLQGRVRAAVVSYGQASAAELELSRHLNATLAIDRLVTERFPDAVLPPASSDGQREALLGVLAPVLAITEPWSVNVGGSVFGSIGPALVLR